MTAVAAAPKPGITPLLLILVLLEDELELTEDVGAATFVAAEEVVEAETPVPAPEAETNDVWDDELGKEGAGAAEAVIAVGVVAGDEVLE